MDAGFIGYAAGGFALGIADKLASQGLKGEWNKHEERKEYVEALDLLVEGFNPETFQQDLRNPDYSEFKDAFLKTREYFRDYKPKQSQIETEPEIISKRKNSHRPGLIRRTLGNISDYFASGRWKEEKINPITNPKKFYISFLAPVIVDMVYLTKVSFSQGLAEFGETLIEGPSMWVGLMTAKGFNKYVIDRAQSKSQNKLYELEESIALNDELTAVLHQKIEMPNPPKQVQIEVPLETEVVQTEVATVEQPVEKPVEQPEIIKKSTSETLQEKLDRMKGIGN